VIRPLQNTDKTTRGGCFFKRYAACVMNKTGSTAGSEMVEVVIHDTGSGLSPENMDRLFEPFFTTKSHGLGLGLSLSRFLVEAEGGHLTADRNTDRGMTFRFTLPVCAGDPDDRV
jgi:signal transduction histidine kinase